MTKAAESSFPGFSAESALKCSAINLWLCIDPLPHGNDTANSQNKAAIWVILHHCIPWNHSLGFSSQCSYSPLTVAVFSSKHRGYTARESRVDDGGRQGGGFVALRDTADTCRSVSPACQLWRYFGEHRMSLQLLPRQPLEAAREQINSLSLLEDGTSTKHILPSQPWGEWMLTLDLDPQESGSELRTLHMDLRNNT